VFCSLLCEGAANDWSAVHIRDTLGGSPAAAASGFAAFSLTMTAGRLLADRLAARFGAVAFLRGAALLAGAGFAATLPAGGPVAGIAGFALLGAGLSGVVPTLFSLAARTPGHPAAAISTVSTIGYLGFLAGPALIGVLAAVGGLRWALAALVVGTAVICAGARAAAG
jgi:MFS family permease